MQMLREASSRSEGVHLIDPIGDFASALVDVFIVHHPDLSFVTPVWVWFFILQLIAFSAKSTIISLSTRAGSLSALMLNGESASGHMILC